MLLWKSLYGTVWLAFFCSVLIPRWLGRYLGIPLHIILGLLLMVLTGSNARRLAVLPVPARLKRISKVTAGFAICQLLTGLGVQVLGYLSAGQQLFGPVMRGLHIVWSFAILSQASSVATAYDMWEEKEFVAESTRQPADGRSSSNPC